MATQFDDKKSANNPEFVTIEIEIESVKVLLNMRDIKFRKQKSTEYVESRFRSASSGIVIRLRCIDSPRTEF